MGIFSIAGAFFRPGAPEDGFNELKVNFSDGICKVGCFKNASAPQEREGKGGREPVDKHLRPLFRPLVIILPIICQ